MDTRDLQRQLLLLTPPEIDAPSEEGTLGEPKLEELAPEKKVEELTPEKGTASKGKPWPSAERTDMCRRSSVCTAWLFHWYVGSVRSC